MEAWLRELLASVALPTDAHTLLVWSLTALALLTGATMGWRLALLLGQLRQIRATRAPHPQDDLLAAYLVERDITRDSSAQVTRDEVVRISLGLPAGIPLWGFKLLAAAAGALGLAVFRLPLPLTVVGAGLGWMATSHVLSQQWVRYVDAIEEDLPLFLGQLSSSLATVANPVGAFTAALSALGERQKRPLAQYLGLLLAQYQVDGIDVLHRAVQEAHHISSVLQTVLTLIKRAYEAGSSSFHEALADASHQIMALQGARHEAKVQTRAARSTTTLVIIILLVAIVGLTGGNVAMRDVFREPFAQAITLAMVIWMILGYFLMEAAIRRAST